MVAFAFVFPISLAGANILIALLFILWVVEGDFKRKVSVIANEKIALIFLALGLLALLSALFSHSQTDGFLTRPNKTLFKVIMSHFFLVPLMLLVFITSIKEHYLKLILSAFLSAIFLSEVVSYLIYFHLIDLHYFQKLHLIYREATYTNATPFMHHTAYSVLLSIAIVLLLDTLLRSKDKVFQVFISIFLLSATVNLFINGGRTGQLGFLFAIILYSILRFRTNIKAIFIIFFTLVAIVFTAYHTSPVFHKRANHALDDIQKVFKGNYHTSWGVRYAANAIVLDYLLSDPKHFFFGAGIGDAKKEFQTYAKEHFPKKMADPIKNLHHLHNQYLQYWFDGTILSFVLFLLYFYLLFTLPVKSDMKALLSAVTIIIMFASNTDVLFFRHKPFMLFLLLTSYFIVSAKKEREHLSI